MLISTIRAILLLFALPALALAGPPASPTPAQIKATHKGISDGITRALSGSCLRSARIGLLVRDLEAERDVFARSDGTAFAPASNMKILTVAAALSRLGPEATFRTSVVTAAAIEDGAVRGDLYLVGGGDPGLVPESLFLMASRLAARGITRIDGDLVGDDSLFDAQLRPLGWPERNFHRAFSAPHSALTAAYSSLSVRVRPTQPGKRVEVELEPFPSFIDLEVTAVTSRRTDSLKVIRTYRAGRNVLRVTGYTPVARGERELVRSVEDPTFYALEGFRTLLAQQGIEVRGGLRRDRAPETAREVTRYDSRPLYQIILDVNKYSSNVMAEMLLKSLAVKMQAPPGTTFGGAQEVLAWLREIGTPTDNVLILDGSGLSEESRVTPRALVAALEYVWQDHAIRPEFLVSLPVGGSDGTLKKRFRGTGRRVRAKTGMVRGAVTLSGYAYGPDDRPYAFSLLVNGHKCPAWKVQKEMDAVILAITGGGV